MGSASSIYLPFPMSVVIMRLIILITLLSISIAGLGVREAGFVDVFGQTGGHRPHVFLLGRLLNMLMALPGAWF
jgi:hypothetical protein